MFGVDREITFKLVCSCDLQLKFWFWFKLQLDLQKIFGEISNCWLLILQKNYFSFWLSNLKDQTFTSKTIRMFKSKNWIKFLSNKVAEIISIRLEFLIWNCHFHTESANQLHIITPNVYVEPSHSFVVLECIFNKHYQTAASENRQNMLTYSRRWRVSDSRLEKFEAARCCVTDSREAWSKFFTYYAVLFTLYSSLILAKKRRKSRVSKCFTCRKQVTYGWENLHVGVKSHQARGLFKHFYHVFKIKRRFKEKREV